MSKHKIDWNKEAELLFSELSRTPVNVTSLSEDDHKLIDRLTRDARQVLIKQISDLFTGFENDMEEIAKNVCKEVDTAPYKSVLRELLKSIGRVKKVAQPPDLVDAFSASTRLQIMRRILGIKSQEGPLTYSSRHILDIHNWENIQLLDILTFEFEPEHAPQKTLGILKSLDDPRVRADEFADAINAHIDESLNNPYYVLSGPMLVRIEKIIRREMEKTDNTNPRTNSQNDKARKNARKKKDKQKKKNRKKRK